jgi:hypothetical protein
VTALLLGLAALAIALCVAWRATTYARDRRDAAWADDWITQLRAMRGAAHWPAGDDDLDDRAAQAEALTAGDLDRRRLDAAVRRHPAGGQR